MSFDKKGEVKWDVALDSEGNYVSIFDAEKGQKYFCPECRGEFVVKKGKIRAWHFAHKGNVPSSCGGESAKHHLMKHKLYYLFSKVGRLYIVYFCEKCKSYHYESILVHSVNIEEKVDDVKPDLLITTSKEKIAVEIVHKNPVDSEKAEKFKRKGIGFLEIWCKDNSDFLGNIVEVKTPVIVPIKTPKVGKANLVLEELTNKTNGKNILLFYRNCFFGYTCPVDVLRKEGYKVINEKTIEVWISRLLQNNKYGTIFEIEKKLGVIFARTEELGNVLLNMSSYYRASTIFSEVPEHIIVCGGFLNKPPYLSWDIFIGKRYGILFFYKDQGNAPDLIEMTIEDVFSKKREQATLLSFSKFADSEDREVDFEAGLFVELLNKVVAVIKRCRFMTPRSTMSRKSRKRKSSWDVFAFVRQKICWIIRC